mmetsp:Transcript_12075/g.28220  ORF Transcript_12075/g.28220 Transcript_12075/m.28220 type:complete len:417 (+) Transcript_12075:2108-3358(+)
MTTIPATRLPQMTGKTGTPRGLPERKVAREARSQDAQQRAKESVQRARWMMMRTSPTLILTKVRRTLKPPMRARSRCRDENPRRGSPKAKAKLARLMAREKPTTSPRVKAKVKTRRVRAQRLKAKATARMPRQVPKQRAKPKGRVRMAKPRARMARMLRARLMPSMAKQREKERASGPMMIGTMIGKMKRKMIGTPMTGTEDGEVTVTSHGAASGNPLLQTLSLNRLTMTTKSPAGQTPRRLLMTKTTCLPKARRARKVRARKRRPRRKQRVERVKATPRTLKPQAMLRAKARARRAPRLKAKAPKARTDSPRMKMKTRSQQMEKLQARKLAGLESGRMPRDGLPKQSLRQLPPLLPRALLLIEETRPRMMKRRAKARSEKAAKASPELKRSQMKISRGYSPPWTQALLWAMAWCA